MRPVSQTLPVESDSVITQVAHPLSTARTISQITSVASSVKQPKIPGKGGRGSRSNNNRPPPGAVNLERSYQICQAVIQNSPNRHQLKAQLRPPPSMLASTNNNTAAGSSVTINDKRDDAAATSASNRILYKVSVNCATVSNSIYRWQCERSLTQLIKLLSTANNKRTGKNYISAKKLCTASVIACAHAPSAYL